MDRSNILAHRGIWSQGHKPNSLSSLEKALTAGFGIETDLRDHCGEIVVSHDPIQHGREIVYARQFLAGIRNDTQKPHGRIALNIKSDGLAGQLKSELADLLIRSNRSFFFDMSIPDTLQYVRADLPFYIRMSEYEERPPLGLNPKGIWMDNFLGAFDQVAAALQYLNAGYRVCVVSSELHHRDRMSLWHLIRESGIHKNQCFEICTDMPYDALRYFSEA